MTTHRFEITPINELNYDKISSQLPEMIPLINQENDIPIPPPLPISLTLINEKTKSSPRLFNSLLHRVKTSSSTADLMRKNNTSSLQINHSVSTTNLTVNKEIDDADSVHSTIHSNTFDTNSLHLTNKFLHELRLKCRELHDKSRNLSIDERIALNRFQYERDIKPAQDIFDVHFELNDDNNNNNNMQNDIFNEDAQEKIRNNIFYELDRQRMKQFHKQHRQLIVGRALLIFITSLLAFMSITLIYVVIDLYNRANYLDPQVVDNEFLSMIYDDKNDI